MLRSMVTWYSWKKNGHLSFQNVIVNYLVFLQFWKRESSLGLLHAGLFEHGNAFSFLHMTSWLSSRAGTLKSC